MKQIKVDAKPKGLEMEIDRQQFALLTYNVCKK